jgi:hypothetical protein
VADRLDGVAHPGARSLCRRGCVGGFRPCHVLLQRFDCLPWRGRACVLDVVLARACRARRDRRVDEPDDQGCEPGSASHRRARGARPRRRHRSSRILGRLCGLLLHLGIGELELLVGASRSQLRAASAVRRSACGGARPGRPGSRRRLRYSRRPPLPASSAGCGIAPPRGSSRIRWRVSSSGFGKSVPGTGLCSTLSRIAPPGSRARSPAWEDRDDRARGIADDFGDQLERVFRARPETDQGHVGLPPCGDRADLRHRSRER